MVQIKHFTAPHKMSNFQFSRPAKWPWWDKIFGAPRAARKLLWIKANPKRETFTAKYNGVLSRTL